MTYQKFINSISKLHLGAEYQYVPATTSSEKKSYRLDSVSEDNIKVTRDNSEVSVSIQQIKTILQNLKKDEPLDIEKLLGSSGNTRSIIESLLCLTPTIFYTKVNKRKHIIDSSSQVHELGVIKEYGVASIEELSAELKKMYDNAPEGGKLSSIHIFGIKYAKVILDKNYSPASIVKSARLNDSYATEISKGVNIYKELSTGLYDSIFKHESNSNEIALTSTFPSSPAATFTLAEDLNNSTTLRYIRALLSKPFTILTGNSGTGKTRIALRLAKYLEKLSSDGKSKNSLLIPVGADWTDNTKLLGFYNPIAHKYQSTKTLDFILNAQGNPDIPFFLILDEMNLSHVERYFSDFLSAMESGEEIPLYKPDKQTKENIPQCIVLPKNLFVTGTVNIDETTYMFSPKVLDRANVIEFKPEMDDVLNLLASASQFPSIGDSALTPEGFLKLANDISVADPANYNSVDFTDAKKIFETFYIKLEGSGFEFAYRTVKEIRNYIIASYELNSTAFNLNAVLDEQLLQKILPKIHGNTRQIKNLLIDLEKLCIEKDTECEFKDGDNQTEKVTGTGWNFELSRNKIHQMRRMLDSLNFASFI